MTYSPYWNLGEYLTKPGAVELAHRIEKYWLKRNYDVKCEVVPFSSRIKESSHLWAVRSNMKNGLPE